MSGLDDGQRDRGERSSTAVTLRGENSPSVMMMTRSQTSSTTSMSWRNDSREVALVDNSAQFPSQRQRAFDVESQRRFVEKHQVGLAGQHTCQRHFLFHPAREVSNRLVGFLGEVEFRQQSLVPVGDGIRLDALDGRQCAGSPGQSAASVVSRPFELPSTCGRLPAGSRSCRYPALESSQNQATPARESIYRRRLARTVGAQQADDRPLLDAKRLVVDGRHRVRTATDALTTPRRRVRASLRPSLWTVARRPASPAAEGAGMT